MSLRNAVQEVESIRAVQSYDLKNVGVIIGPDGRLDLQREQLPKLIESRMPERLDMEDDQALGKTCTDGALAKSITQINAVLLTQGICGTYMWVLDPGLWMNLPGFVAPQT